MSRNPNAASIWSKLTIGEKILTQNSQPSELPIVAAEELSMRVFHTENAICMKNIPTDVQMILLRHFLVSSSSLDEKRSRITPMMRNMTAIAMKKFLIWNAIVVNVPRTHSAPDDPAEKKNQRIGLAKLSRSSLELLVEEILTSRTLISRGAADTSPDANMRAIQPRNIRIYIERKKILLVVYTNAHKNANILAFFCLPRRGSLCSGTVEKERFSYGGHTPSVYPRFTRSTGTQEFHFLLLITRLFL